MSTGSFIAAAALFAGALVSSLPAAANDKAIIVLDASGSMWGQIDGKTKIEIARDTLAQVLTTIPDTLDLGLIAYGHREKGSCADIEEIVAPAPGTRGDIEAAVRALNPKGKTPLADSVKKAAEALKYTEEKATVILVTDGIETCNADPCALASELEKLGVDFTAHVVGFGLNEEEGRKVACLAENTGGKYLPAANADELAGALTETVTAAPEPEPEPEPAPAPEPAAIEENLAFTAVLTEGGDPVPVEPYWEVFEMDGDTPGASVVYGYGATYHVKVPAGRYLVKVEQNLVSAETIVEASETEVTERDLVLNAGILKVSVAADETAEVDDSARFDIHAGSESEGGYGRGTFLVPAGDLTVKARLGEAEVEESFAIKAGEAIEKKIIAAAGVLAVEAIYAEGGPALESDDQRVDVLSAKMDLEGNRKEITGGYGPGQRFKLAPGDYVVRVRMGVATGEAPVTVKKGEMTPVTVNVNAGVLAVKAPGAYRIDILPAKANLQGERNSIAGNYGEEFQLTLPPGDYVAVAIIGDGLDGPKKEVAVSVKAAERSEIAVE